MLKQKEIWLDDEKRNEQLDNAKNNAQSTYFGFQRIPKEEKAGRVLNHFNTIADHYDIMNTLLSLGIHHLWKRLAVQMLELASGNRVLDVCGGTGDLAIQAAKRIGSDGRVIIYDINRAMILAGLPKVANRDFEPRIRYVQGDAESISFPDANFDATMVGFGIRNVTNMKKGFEEMYRVLKPGGKMLCLEFSKPTFTPFRWLYDIYSFYIMPFLGELIAGSRTAYTHLPETIRMWPLPDELTEILKEIGFSDVSHRKLTNGIAVIHLAIK
ncbi:MAG: bifunctional demethylmenaquinone methyltransferase/2-methoxy-6-polyprenyl-1,4-benzoquinol methylase UbiE [Deltaproteobacteria bacterium]|jgi:demethylmenaquinone methyltransferase/2-methoxy-6-polyprenyl-1,4-benzoquinol methylase|nr:bifunctional demethylmenaquinone methyltransferase/2-methoxy-6-polyprenyl-1,4-benzoquinol methylase UbiE [Deltaproteobacteria bacterium]